jgi:hypothetical protein
VGSSTEQDRASASSPCAYDCRGTFQMLGDDPIINRYAIRVSHNITHCS